MSVQPGEEETSGSLFNHLDGGCSGVRVGFHSHVTMIGQEKMAQASLGQVQAGFSHRKGG